MCTRRVPLAIASGRPRPGLVEQAPPGLLRTQVDLTTVVGQRSVCYNPAFPHYVLPDPMDQLLGGSQRPHGRAFLLLDGFD